MPKISRIHGSNADDNIDARGISAILQGGKGDDTYYVDSVDDIIIEKNSGGIDTIISQIGWILDQHSENLTLAGTSDISGTGNDSDNTLVGNDGANSLLGLTGNDSMFGGDGTDSLLGGDGDDSLDGGAGADLLDGGQGQDTALFDGQSTDYAFEWSKGDLLVTDTGGTTDVLRGVETLQFSDGALNVEDITGGEDPPAEPVATSDFSPGQEDNSITIDVLQNDFGEGIALLAAENGLKGQVVMNGDGTLTYTPDADAHGEDSFSYSIVDTLGRTSTAEVVVDVTAVNDAPGAVADAYGADLDGELIADSVLLNDTDPDGDALTVVAYDTSSALGGAVAMNADGTFHYQPPSGVTGNDGFSYTVDDGQGEQSTAFVSISIAATNTAPVANADSYSTTASQPLSGETVLANDVDPDGDNLAILSYDGTTVLGGTVSMSDDGTFTYTPPEGATGTDSFTYTIDDGNGGTAGATATIDLTLPENTAPTAQADSYELVVDTVLEGNVTDNDSDLDGDAISVVTYDSTTAAGGSVAMLADGSFVYTPPQGFMGSDSFGYTIDDGNANSSSADVSLNVSATEELPYYVEELLANSDWQRLNYPDDYGTSVTVTYTFLEYAPDYYQDAETIAETFQSFSDQQRDVTREFLTQIENFANMTFVEVASPDDATLAFGIQDLGGDNKATSWYPNGNSTGDFYADIWMDTALAGDTFAMDSEAFHVLLHEIGHTVGLSHPVLPSEESNIQYTVMETADHIDGYLFDESVSDFQLYDIAALQYIYGANETYRAGDDVYSFEMLDDGISTIWDGGGHDTIDMSAADYGVSIDLNDGAFSTVAPTGNNNVAIAFGTDIEDAIGGGFDDRLTGNTDGNVLSGGQGNDTFVMQSDWGLDTITDFTQGEDKIHFEDTGLTMNDLAISLTETGILVAHDDNEILLREVTEIDEEDFLF